MHVAFLGATSRSDRNLSAFCLQRNMLTVLTDRKNICRCRRIHEKIACEIGGAIDPWSADCRIGAVYAQYSDEIARAYLPYVTGYDESRKFLQETLRQKPKFQAFLSRCLALPEFGRQSLFDILIRPVQRLPTVSLLLKDLLKHTEDTSPDFAGLTAAITSLDGVLKMINSSGRTFDAQFGGSFSPVSSNGNKLHKMFKSDFNGAIFFESFFPFKRLRIK